MAAVRCVVVNFNAGGRLADCVGDLLRQRPEVAVSVVDNASTDDSMDRLARGLAGGAPVELLRNETNRGFGPACNQAALDAKEEFLAFVNPDCRLGPDVLERLREALVGSPGAAAAGAMVTNPDGGEQRGTRRRLPTPWRALMTFSGLERLADRFPMLAGVNVAGPAANTTTAVEAVNGACFLVRARVFRELDGFDEGYFLHCEDLDLFRRVAIAGFKVVLVPVPVIHYQGTSSRTAPLAVHWHKHRGMMHYLLTYRRRGDWLWLPPVLVGLWLRFILLVPLVWWRGR